LPESLLKAIKASSVKIYFTASNPFILFSPYVQAGGIDPEPSGQGSSGLVGGIQVIFLVVTSISV
jgi:hypothetical protein